MFGLSQKSCSWRARNSKDWFRSVDSARWPATPAHPCTALTQRGLSSRSIESRFNCFLTKCMIGLPKLISENRLCEPNSIKKSSKIENLESSSYEKTAMKSAINCQSEASLQSSAIESKHNHLNFSAPQFPGTACVKSSLLCLRWDWSLTTHSYHCST